jgi:hypothetical protein
MAELLGLESEEQVKRLARARKLPPRVPAVKKWLWLEDMVRDWMRSGYEISEDVKKQVRALTKAHGDTRKKVKDLTKAHGDARIKVKALTEAHGGVHVDETTGETKVGDKVDIQVMVYSKKSKRGKKIVRETKRKSSVIPGHHE